LALAIEAPTLADIPSFTDLPARQGSSASGVLFARSWMVRVWCIPAMNVFRDDRD